MVPQKRYFGKLLKIIFDPFLGLKSPKMTIFARFLSFSRFLGPKNHENPYFYKISKITFFWHPMRMVYDRFQVTGAIWWPFWWNYKCIKIYIKYMFSYVKLDGESKYELRKTNRSPKNIFWGVTYKSLYKSARKELGRHFRVF